MARDFRHEHYDQVAEAAAFLKSRLGSLAPRVGIVLGSGLGAAADAVADPVIVPYSEIPHFPQSTVEGHSGRIVAGSARRRSGCRACRGACTSYEGYSPLEVTFPMRVLGALGVRAVVLTNAAGGIQAGYQVGQLVLLADHINHDGLESAERAQRAALRLSPRRGAALLRHDRGLLEGAAGAGEGSGKEEGFALEEGIYLATPGPSFETPAEIRAFRTLGATLVGMSTVPETIVARHMGIEVLGISCVTNLAAGLGATPLSHEEVYRNRPAGGERGWPHCSSALRRKSPPEWKRNREPTSRLPSCSAKPPPADPRLPFPPTVLGDCRLLRLGQNHAGRRAGAHAGRPALSSRRLLSRPRGHAARRARAAELRRPGDDRDPAARRAYWRAGARRNHRAARSTISPRYTRVRGRTERVDAGPVPDCRRLVSRCTIPSCCRSTACASTSIRRMSCALSAG